MLVCEATQSANSPSYDAGRIQTASSRHRLQRNMRVACITASDDIFVMCQEARLLCLWGAHCCFCLLPHYRRAVASCSNLEAEALTSLTTMCMVLSHVHLSIPHNSCRLVGGQATKWTASSTPVVLQCVTCCATSASCHEYPPQGGISVHCCTIHQRSTPLRGEFHD